VTFDGVDIRDIKLASLRDNIAMMPQDPLLFPVSIAENIGYGRSGASLAEIVRAAQEAHADEFIRRLPQGYGTVLGSRGSTLSGGERQRIAIARALLKKSLVLILDEPTSALDTESESLLMDAIERARLGRTVIFIAHRLSTAQRADRVLVIERGHIVESGSPSSLLDAGGTYSRFYAASAGNALAGAAS
jgi:ATP-binding cassette subfamily B protein/subfamily B ATP-binding cassette protein MsbA